VGRHLKAFVAVSALLSALAVGTGSAAAAPPTVSIDPSQSASYATAHVTGKVDPADQETYYYFEFAIDPESEGWSQGPEAYSDGLQPNTGETAVDEYLTGLKPGSEYKVRLVATNFIEEPVYSPAPYPTFTTEPVSPPSVSIDPVTSVTGTTAHFSGKVDPEAPVNDPAFNVDWHFECTPACTNVDSGTVAAEVGEQSVQAEASGLDPNTDYEVVLVAKNAGDPVNAGPEQFRTGFASPQVKALYAAAVGSTTALLGAEVNPRNTTVTYQFEWGTDNGFGNLAPATFETLGPEDNSFHVVTTPLVGLKPNQSFEYRLVAKNGNGESSVGDTRSFRTFELITDPTCSNAAFRVGASASLPGCRAYEKVSPDDKNGVDATQVAPNSITRYGFAADDGKAVAYLAKGSFAGQESVTAPGQSVRSERTAQGWQTRGIAPRFEINTRSDAAEAFQGFSDDLSTGVVATFGAVNAGDPLAAGNVYRKRFGSSSWELLTPTLVPLPAGTISAANAFRGADADFSHVALSLWARLTPEANVFPAAGIIGNLYLATPSGVEFVAYLPDPDGAGPLSEEPTTTAAFLGSMSGGARGYPGQNAISEDGSRVYFTVEPLSGIGADKKVYMRANGESTAEVSESQRTVADPAGPAEKDFELASADGSVAFFSSYEKLTDGATAGGNGPERAGTADLYRYDAETKGLSDVTTQDPNGAGVLGTLGASDAADIVYFAATGVLDQGATAGAANLYKWTAGDGVHFIASLRAGSGGSGGDGRVWTDERITTDAGRESRVSPDGRHVVFSSRERLTSYDTAGFEQVYLYDAETDALTCVSCSLVAPASQDHTGIRGGSNPFPMWFRQNLSDDGSRVVFETAEPLVSADTNGATDVYLWEAGRLELLSTGESREAAALLDSSASGNDIFIATRQPLLAADTDDLVDVYDVSVGGGFDETVAPDSPCTGEECQGASPAGAVSPRPATVREIPSSRNLRPRCPKGKVRRKGRCVKKKHRARRDGSSKRGGATR